MTIKTFKDALTDAVEKYHDIDENAVITHACVVKEGDVTKNGSIFPPGTVLFICEAKSSTSDDTNEYEFGIMPPQLGKYLN